MVNIYINFDKEYFKSKTSIPRLKKCIRKLVDDGYNSELLEIHVSLKDYLNENLCKNKQLKFNRVEEDIFIKLIDKEKEVKDSHKIKLKELVDIRTGVKQRELNELRKDVKNNNDKQLYKKYDILKSIYNAPIEKPHVLIKECEKFRDQIEIFASGFMEFTEDERINDMVRDYHRIISDRLGWKLLSMNEFIVKYYNESGNPKDITNLEINNDSETESEGD
jgi:hypothetical protein